MAGGWQELLKRVKTPIVGTWPGLTDIISQKTRINLEKMNLPDYKRRWRKRLTAIVVLGVAAFAPEVLMDLGVIPFIPFAYYYLPLAAVWLVAVRLWERPESSRLREWEKRRWAELGRPTSSGTD